MLLTSCGYHLGTGSLTDRYNTITVPYAQGDTYGFFTEALVEKVAAQSSLRYVNNEGDLKLKVCLTSPSARNIGFRYATGNNSKVTTANEGRLTQTATVTVIDCEKGCTVLGPFKVSTYIDYDFESDFATRNAHAFSLGQLEMNPLAKDAASRALHSLLAEKIVDYVTNSW